jgi:hypothetical protein
MRKKEKIKTVYIVTYNDCYGNGDQTSVEAVLEKRSDFSKWLKEHNANRKTDGNERELAEEFDIDSEKLLTYPTKKKGGKDEAKRK